MVTRAPRLRKYQPSRLSVTDAQKFCGACALSPTFSKNLYMPSELMRR